jgi:transcriptional regulator with PAS, ATPase and Fis domain
VGGSKEIRVDVRVIAATNRAPAAALAAGQLREDLFYRLGVFLISVSPLRDRRDDIVPLAYRFIEEFNLEYDRKVIGLSANAEEALLRHSWPGNVRELRNVVQRAVALTPGPLLTAEHLTPTLPVESPSPAAAGRTTPEPTSIRDMERRLIIEALKRTGNDKTRAAVELGISPKTLYNKLAKYKIRLVKA